MRLDECLGAASNCGKRLRIGIEEVRPRVGTDCDFRQDDRASGSAVRFDQDGIVSGIERFKMKDGKAIKPVERKTPTRGREFTVIEQLFGNIGRFSNQTEN